MSGRATYWIDPWRCYQSGVLAYEHPQGPSHRLRALLRGAEPLTPDEALELAGWRARQASATPPGLQESYGVASAGPDWVVVASRGWPHDGDAYAPVELRRRTDPRNPSWVRGGQ